MVTNLLNGLPSIIYGVDAEMKFSFVPSRLLQMISGIVH